MKYGLLGAHLTHSFSVPIHIELGNNEYELCPVDEKELETLLRTKDFCGFNVTIPYKQTVIPYCDVLSATAKKIGAVNTLVCKKGKLYGYNTDYFGFHYNAEINHISFFDKTVLILGSGGTSHTAECVVRDCGAKSVTVVSRSGENNYSNMNKNAQIIINTTPVGMYPNTDACTVDLSEFPSLCGVIDVIYNPLRTKLLLQAEQLGIPHANGLAMLVAQAKQSEELFLNQTISDCEIMRIYNNLFRQKANIVLIGMPGSGKSEIGKKIAKKMQRKHVDIDTLVEANAQMPIPQIINTYGEQAFRRLETEALEICKESGLVISTGGGAVLKSENRALLRQNGIVYQILRDRELLSTDARPLSSNLEEMEQVRMPLYNACADRKIINNRTVLSAARKICTDFINNDNHKE